MIPCPGTGGVVYTYEGPQFGPQLVEEPCEVCGEWHESPSDRAEREAYAHWLDNPGAIRKAWRRFKTFIKGRGSDGKV